MKLYLLPSLFVLMTTACSDGKFASGEARVGSSAPADCKPSSTKSCATTSSPDGTTFGKTKTLPGGGSLPGTGDSSTQEDQSSTPSGKLFLSQSISTYYFSGNGPGSCTYNATCGMGAPACEAGHAIIQGLMFADCPDSGEKFGWCYGNRSVCEGNGKTPTEKIAIDLKLVSGTTCASIGAEWEDATPIIGGKHHMIGFPKEMGNSGTYTKYAFCRKTTDALTTGTEIVTDIKMTPTPGSKLPAGNCPSGYIDAGTAPDCVFNPDPSKPKGCAGEVRLCLQKKAYEG